MNSGFQIADTRAANPPSWAFRQTKSKLDKIAATSNQQLLMKIPRRRCSGF